MSTEHNRLLLEIERAMRAINQETIKPLLPDLTLTDLDPVITMVAKSRALYLQELIELSRSCSTGTPTDEQVERLRKLRLSFEEQVSAVQALETAIHRGYLNVHPH